jgi:methylenetetrahydrofolate dehydrogenase (NADP+)/methenyltetrahydrofolate cyclohydrolase
MQVDGRALATQIQQRLTAAVADMAPRVPRLGIVACAPDAVTKQYLHLKQTKAEAIGIAVQKELLSSGADTEAVKTVVTDLASQVDGLVVQLPLPSDIDRVAVLDTIPLSVDVDALRGVISPYVSPVARAMEVILREHQVSLVGQSVLVVGAGALVGTPVAQWFRNQQAKVTVVTATDTLTSEITKAADIIVLGTGCPGLLTPEMITAETVVLDAGTAEASGRIQGDADPTCAQKAALFTPVPGGIGPLTIMTLLENVVQASLHQSIGSKDSFVL